jgi:pimeloyl-ACP methyl ester carboxylesterase
MPEPQSRFIAAGDIQLHVLDWGGSDERLLILLHGLSATVHMFDLIAADLADRHHVYAVDLRGHGLSDQPGSGYDFESLSVDLDRLLAALNPNGIPVCVLGHSWGAYLALYYAATRPVERLVLLDGGFRPMSDLFPTWKLGEIGLAPPANQKVTRLQVEDYIEYRLLKGVYRPEIGPLALSSFDLSDPQQVTPRLKRPQHLQLAHAHWAFDPAEYFPRVTKPVLIVVAVPEGAEIIHFVRFRLDQALSMLPNARLVIMRDTVHAIPWHRPRELVAVLNEFL